jgi:hypothetical protein
MKTKKIKTESNSVVVVVKEMETSSSPSSESHTINTGVANENSDSNDNNSNNENKNLVEIVENITLNTVIVEKKKRGRKKLIKPDTVTADSQKNKNMENDKVEEENMKNCDENVGKTISTGIDKKEKKQPKIKIPKIDKQQSKELCSSENIQDPTSSSPTLTNVVVHKKRGRKPRGGKIIHENQMQTNNSPEVPNIILHLKCVLSDLKKNELISNKIDTYSNDKKGGILCYNEHDQNSIFSSNVSNIANYEKCDKNRNYNKDIVVNAMKEDEQMDSENVTKIISSAPNQKYDPSSFSSKNTHPATVDTNTNPIFAFSDKEIGECELECKNATNKEIWKRISQLKLNFHKNDSLGIQRSACFWDTCEFDTPPIHIPMSSTKGYGCFCHPECAVAFLMNENIDTSIKFERYYLLNSIYGPIYNYNKSIKPAANPHYLLNKFYGNLTINEYRKLFQCEQVVYMVNKPLTNVLPELYEDNNDFFIGNKIIQNNTIEIKKKVVKNAKSSIINEAFGIK